VEQLPYPETPRNDVADEYHGRRIPDPYRWLEDLDSPQTRAWITAQNAIVEQFLSRVPARSQIRKRLQRLWNYERFGIPHKEGGRYFLTYNSGLQNQSALYWLANLDGQLNPLLDPNPLSKDGTVALSSWSPSRDGKLLAYSLSIAGSDWREWKVRNVATGEDLDDHIQWSKFSGASWTKDGTGFFYSRYDAPAAGKLVAANYFQKLFFHRLGSPQADDVLVYERPDHKEWGFSGEVTEDGRFLVIHVWRGTDVRNGVFLKDLTDADSPVLELLADFDATYRYVANEGTRFTFFTNHKSPRGRIIALDLARPGRDHWEQTVAEMNDTLEEVTFVGGRLIGRYLKDAYSRVRIFDANGRLAGDVPLPGIGTASGFAGKPGDPETFFSFTNFVTPTTIFRLDLAAGATSVFRQPKGEFDPSGYESRQVFYASKDGARIPMFVTSKKGLKADRDRPTFLTGYGGFNISITPAYSATNAVWLEMGGVLAVPNLRGGGEYGEPWHQAGMKLKKQNVFSDFIAAAEWLIANKFTRSDKLAIGGRSNGGLLVGACMTQRPDLFGAAIPAVGVFDMLRYHKFTIGWAWTPEYGTPENPDEFKALLAYSPLHNVKRGVSYPPTLLTTGDHDDRVVPAHSYKFAAALQWAQSGHAPILIRVDTQAGHGAGKPTAKLIDEAADGWAFLAAILKMDLKQFDLPKVH
jgi:prolyl oligopeptidase